MEIGNPDLLEEIRAKHLDPKPFLQVAAARGLSIMQKQLQASYTEGGYRTGRLMASLAPGGEHSISQVEQFAFSVGTNLEYAAIQDRGGVIIPKTGRALAIPATPKMRRAAKWPRDFARGDLRFVPLKRGTLVGFLVDASGTFKKGKRTGGGKLGFGTKALFWLVTKVTIAAKNYATWDQVTIDKIIQRDWPDFLAGKLVA